MRAVMLILLASTVAPGADVALNIPLSMIAHPMRALRSVPAGRRWSAIADGLLESANAVDYFTTRRGAFPGRGGCELNPLLTKAPCEIDVGRFTAIKMAVAVLGAVQWVPVLNVPALAMADAAIALPLVLADIGNAVQLKKR